MIVYIIMVLLSLVFAYFATKAESKKKKIIFILLMMLPFILVSGFRYGVGTDYFYRYVTDYNNIANGINVENLEIGFKILIYLCLIFSKNSEILFIITSIIIAALVIGAITKNSKNVFISIIIFGLGGFFFQSMNLVRQFIAMAIIFYAYSYLLKENKIKWYIVAVLIASLFHVSSLIMLVLIFCRKKVIFKPALTLSLTVIIVLFGGILIELVKPLLSLTRFDVYLVGKFAKEDQSLLYTLINTTIYIFMIIIYKDKEKRSTIINKEEKAEMELFINIQALALIFMTMSCMHMLFARIAYYFSIFQIISIPFFVEISEVKIKNFKRAKVKKLMYTAIIVCFLLLTFYTNIIHNDHGVLPYTSIFNTDLKLQ